MENNKRWYVRESGDWGYGWETFKRFFDTYEEAEEYCKNQKTNPYFNIAIIDRLEELNTELTELKEKLAKAKKEIEKIKKNT